MTKKIAKKRAEALSKVDVTKRFTLEEAVEKALATAYAKFDESMDIAVRLGVNPRHADQKLRGAIVLPNGTGKGVRVLVFARGDKEKEAREAGADFTGADELAAEIQGGMLDFERVIATPDMMGVVGKLGRVLGPRGLMPNPKLGTVTTDVAGAVREAKAGKVEYEVDKGGVIHCSIGRKSFSAEKLTENALALIRELVNRRPPTAKGVYLRSITLSSTMGLGVRVDAQTLALKMEER